MMSTNRRSSRIRKAVDYSKCGDLSDDDFAESHSQPSKKTKLGKEVSNQDSFSNKKEDNKNSKMEVKDSYTPKRNKNNKVTIETLDVCFKNEDKPIGNRRLSVKEKIDQRNLEIVLEMSKNQDLSEIRSDKNSPPNTTLISIENNLNTEKAVSEPDKICEKPLIRPRCSASRSRIKQPHLSENESNGSLHEDYSDSYETDDNSDNDDENYEGTDSELDVSSTKKTTIKKKTNSHSKTFKSMPHLIPEVSPASGKSVETKSVNSQSEMKSTPSPKIIMSPSIISPKQNHKCSWVPPGSINSSNKSPGGIVIRSPGTGLRIGLSRKQVLKPLHTSIKVGQ